MRNHVIARLLEGAVEPFTKTASLALHVACLLVKLRFSGFVKLCEHPSTPDVHARELLRSKPTRLSPRRSPRCAAESPRHTADARPEEETRHRAWNPVCQS